MKITISEAVNKVITRETYPIEGPDLWSYLHIAVLTNYITGLPRILPVSSSAHHDLGAKPQPRRYISSIQYSNKTGQGIDSA